MIKSESLTVKQLFDEYSGHCRPETGRKVQIAINRLLSRVDITSGKITLLDVERKRTQLMKAGVKGQTVNTYCASLSWMWN